MYFPLLPVSFPATLLSPLASFLLLSTRSQETSHCHTHLARFQTQAGNRGKASVSGAKQSYQVVLFNLGFLCFPKRHSGVSLETCFAAPCFTPETLCRSKNSMSLKSSHTRFVAVTEIALKILRRLKTSSDQRHWTAQQEVPWPTCWNSCGSETQPFPGPWHAFPSMSLRTDATRRTEQILWVRAANSPNLPTGETGLGSTIAISLYANTIIGATTPPFHNPQWGSDAHETSVPV